MGEFQTYIMDEDKNLVTKMDIIRRLQNLLFEKRGESIFFDKSVIFKTEIARMFIDYMNIDVDRDLVLTACLLCNCKKVDNAQKLGRVKTYAKEGADYLLNIGFDPRFCKICEGVNRYSGLKDREQESDILELVDHFGGMLLDRPERAGFSPEEAIIQMERDNLKDVDNKYLNTFHTFVDKMQQIQIQPSFYGEKIGILKQPFSILKKNVCDDAKDLADMIKRIKDYEITLDEKMQELEIQPIFQAEENAQKNNIKVNTNSNTKNRKNIQVESRSLFTKETVERISHLNTNDSKEENLERGA
ncbi:MAG: hypothetical protein IJH76_03070 [Clostridia bacterium]|nr:hypothetical protein [Clostridia bacterium]